MWKIDIRGKSGPTYLAVANAYAEAIERGDLPAGTRLPPQRDLARQLGVTVGTISRAYALIKKRELVTGEVGRGTYVRGNIEDPPSIDFSSERTAAGAIDLACFCTPNDSVNALIAEVVTSAFGRAGLHGVHRYPPSAGLVSHRGDGARWLARYGVETTADRVIVCGGAQLALNAALRAFVAKGESLLCEATTYAGLRAVCAVHEIPMHGLAMDDHGLLPEALERAVAAGVGRVVVVQPTLHNPTTASMPEERRRQIAKLAIKHDLLIVEDDTASGMLLHRPPAIVALAPEHTIHITSVSKCLSPAFRLGYITASRGLLERMERMLHAFALSAPPFISDVMSALIASGAADRIVQINLEETGKRHALIKDAIKSAGLKSHPAAVFAWLNLPAQWRSHEFVAAALRSDVNVADGDNFRIDRSGQPDAVRLSVDGSPSHQGLRHGLKVVADLLRQQPQSWMPVI